ncbi:hypothetical protein [Pseudomonas sp. EMN2]|uniref:hypothetical protein n=1 Tax=Pseudomonas sp. EMN2 TaxID=2615212 RepID=UPI00129B9E7E|nr:hypothetical protein [Pseudomonas sp. EMN2]
MSENDQQGFDEALRHWASAVEDARACELAETIKRAEQAEIRRIWRAFHSSALGVFYSSGIQKDEVKDG